MYTAAKVSAAFRLNGFVRLPSATAVRPAWPLPMSHAAAPPAAAITARMGSSRGRMPASTAPASTAMRTHMMVEASTAADAAAGRAAPVCERSAIEMVIAVLDTSPPTAPVIAMPRPAPSTRMATKPTKESAETSTTTIQISRGLSACQGP